MNLKAKDRTRSQNWYRKRRNRRSQTATFRGHRLVGVGQSPPVNGGAQKMVELVVIARLKRAMTMTVGKEVWKKVERQLGAMENTNSATECSKNDVRYSYAATKERPPISVASGWITYIASEVRDKAEIVQEILSLSPATIKDDPPTLLQRFLSFSVPCPPRLCSRCE